MLNFRKPFLDLMLFSGFLEALEMFFGVRSDSFFFGIMASQDCFFFLVFVFGRAFPVDFSSRYA